MSNVTGITGNLCNKCPKWLVEQISSYSDYFNAISGFTSNSRAPRRPCDIIVLTSYRLGMVNSKSFVDNDFLQLCPVI